MRLFVVFVLLIGPQLKITAPPELASVQRKLEAIDSNRFGDIGQTVGLADPGPPIQVVLAPESSEVDPWIAGFASREEDMVVQNGSIPYGTSIEEPSFSDQANGRHYPTRQVFCV
jgi:hypothetical protein